MGWVVNATPRLLYPRKRPDTHCRWAPGPVWTGAENLTPTGIQSSDRPARSESLYRLSYPGPQHSFYNQTQIMYTLRVSTTPPPPSEQILRARLSQTVTTVTDRGPSNVEILDSNRAPAVLPEVSMVFLTSYRTDPHIISRHTSPFVIHSPITPPLEAIPTLSVLLIASVNNS
jgi:hypothetical protein